MGKTISCINYSIAINETTFLQKCIFEIRPSSVIVIVDENTEQFCLPKLYEQLDKIHLNIIRIPSGEQYKTINTCQNVWQKMTALGADRHSLVLNLGGGVIGDLGGFCASTYMRGIRFIQIPTTLLSQVDASVGGKLGVDLEGVKNMIGVFQEPYAVVIDTSFLRTLPYKELLSGYAELLKHGLIANASIWEYLSTQEDITVLDFEETVYQSVLIKKSITEQDPTEKGIRKILNFGHTVGHAIETKSFDTDQHLLHGEAIAIGMVIESYLSYALNYISYEEYQIIKSRLQKLYGNKYKSLPTVEDILPTMIKDKKNNAGVINYALIDKIGSAIYDQVVDTAKLHQAFSAYKA
ncbi:MAG TPA: 3-dehydroquinate synthase [Saprospiraceae bacterium]|nr:3-dehydroquinate synthase [Saprospiraceae bacterium]